MTQDEKRIVEWLERLAIEEYGKNAMAEESVEWWLAQSIRRGDHRKD